MNLRRVFAVFRARNNEFLRDRASLGWNIIFPVFIVAGFAFAFSGGDTDIFKVGVHGGTPDPALHGPFFATQHIRFVPEESLEHAVTAVERHQLDMAVDLGTRRYWINATSPNGYMVEKVLAGTGSAGFERQTVTGREIRYVDWLIPGVMGMNMMFSALFGVGYVIVRYRKNGVLRRLKATPLTAFEFLTAQIASRLWLIILFTTLVFVGTDLFIDFAMFGSYLTLFIVFVFGAVSMISLGLLIAARIASEEMADGVLNLISWPMMFLSGVWFSLEGTNPLVQKLALAFPLTHMTNAARAVMIDGAGLVQVAPQLAVLAVMSVVFIAIGAWNFRWETE
jgi:ABC-type multidrug transport system permease subunit